MKTFVRWSGNKSRYLKHILPHVPGNFNTYIEPFLGSGALFLSLKPAKWIVNDINKDVINLWNFVKEDPGRIIDTLNKIAKPFVAMAKTDKVLFCRKLTLYFQSLPYNQDRAAIYLFLKYSVYMGNLTRNGKFCFPGLELNLYDTNKPIYYLSVPFFQNIQEVGNYLKGSKGKIACKDFTKVLASAKPNDFVFLDPPYLEDHNYDFIYNIGETIDAKFFDKIKSQVVLLDKKNVKWLMTQADTPYIREMFSGYRISSFPVFRGYTNTYKRELIIKNY
jgi:DNA adenine methylase